jgi:ADP-heptose:LPS heptosyltransferase
MTSRAILKILIIKPSSFGDIVQALPCANALKKAYPKCEISWVVFSDWEALLCMCCDIDRIIIWNRKDGLKGFFKTLKQIRKIKYDIIIDLQGLIRSSILAKFAKAEIKIGVPGMKEFSNFLIKELYSDDSNVNATLRNLKPVYFITGKEFKPGVNIKISIDENKILHENKIFSSFITLIPFARGKGKDWSVLNYHKLINLIKKKYVDMQIVILGSSNDFERIQSNMVVDLCGKTTIKELAAILLRSSVAVGADTGPMHLSSVLGTPSVFIFGSSDINETAPYIGQFSLLANKNNSKYIDYIKPETVFLEINKWIK